MLILALRSSLNDFYFQALAASGLRSIRYALEVDGVGEVIAVDNNEGAFVCLTIKY
jgi:tRNA G26 N,N-dimethylase Trm1